MTKVKLTKNALREQELKLKQLQKYLPTLQLKKALLQAEVHQMESLIKKEERLYLEKKGSVKEWTSLLSRGTINPLLKALHVIEVVTKEENIAGIDLPKFEKVRFQKGDYSLYTSPLWWDDALLEIRSLIEKNRKIDVEKERKKKLEKELREVSIRVNLFEKILIPRTESFIKKIRIFLGDQELSAIAQSKVAKQKIGKKREGLLS